jgi:hypothetical protein
LPELDGSSLMRGTCELAGTNRAITAIRSIVVQAGTSARGMPQPDTLPLTAVTATANPGGRDREQGDG